jgi:hypothetical protein
MQTKTLITCSKKATWLMLLPATFLALTALAGGLYDIAVPTTPGTIDPPAPKPAHKQRYIVAQFAEKIDPGIGMPMQIDFVDVLGREFGTDRVAQDLKKYQDVYVKNVHNAACDVVAINLVGQTYSLLIGCKQFSQKEVQFAGAIPDNIAAEMLRMLIVSKAKSALVAHDALHEGSQ